MKLLYELKDVHMQFGRKETVNEVIKGIELTINQGEIVAITGPSGAGKSTLLNILSGLEKATSGVVNYKGDNLAAYNQKQLAKLRLSEFGFVFQSFYLISSLSVQDNILLPTLTDKGEVDMEFYKELCKRLEITDRLQAMPYQLSGGEKQRVAIARALLNKPEIIFADEPSGNLDSVNGKQVFELLFDCAKEYKQTLIYVTHDEQKASMAERRLVIKDGVLQ